MSKSAFAAVAAALLAIGVSAPSASAQDIEAVELMALPTQVTISVAGKALPEVRQEVRQAARYVCRNATARGELDVADLGWCAYHSKVKAMKRYHQLTAVQFAGGDAAIRLSSR